MASTLPCALAGCLLLGAVAIHLDPSVTEAGPARDLKPLTDPACDLKTLTLNVLTGNRSEGGTNLGEFLEEQRLVNEAGAEVICETGFNFGASSLAFLCANPNTHVYSFDIGAHPYVHTAKDYLDSHFGAERLTLTIGDSTQTLPAAAEAGGVLQGKKCDVAFVDGGHTTPVALADIENFARLTKSGGLMLLENCNSQGRQRGWGGMNAVNAAYKEAVERGLVQHVAQVSTHCSKEESPMTAVRSASRSFLEQGRRRGAGGMNAVNEAHEEAVEGGAVQHVARESTHCGEEEKPHACR
eukprot:CAMPEP_0171169580 /NCGR_PEP_ID=MMETSP0790-20130122/8284_1 /TAXON_ID=2925 /ORGANISM="Alexandrium catenella, Strain OF101" /LENGTH=297 /DNA_ID=CAMNT_0011634425 /DNA_START=89 /DNA_END=980 /DNA_ORIENTATION=+